MQLLRSFPSKAIRANHRPLCLSIPRGIHSSLSKNPTDQTQKPTHRSRRKMSLWYPRFGLPHHSESSTSSPTFSSLFRMLDDFDKYARDIGSPSSHDSSSGLQNFNPKFDVTEHDKDYTLQGELPGVPSNNVSIEFTDPQTMVISGHVEKKHEEGDPSLKLTGTDSKKIEGKKGDKSSSTAKSSEESSKPKYWLSERSFGEFSRVFSFPNSVDQDKVEAKFNNGILDITVPKSEKKGAKKITIK
ncbi:putative heat shock protein [Podospora fimiseda]|uniref:Heat shock protein n=1 Tax=Podospora fimiseda TaxID=252190 RepID=A0AAN7BK10_9PEZI|nr:putative heat shock protein [Podospora fimiseda]